MKTAKEILQEILGVSKDELYMEDKLNRHVPLDDVLDAMSVYADQFQPKWISMTDKLPPLDTDVLMLNRNYTVPVYAVGFRMLYGSCEKIVVPEPKNGYLNYTHWMKLPE